MEVHDLKTHVADLRDVVRRSRGVRVEELTELRSAAENLGGHLVGVAGLDDDGDWCGTGRFRFPWPPKRGSVGGFIDTLLNKGIGGHILINGIVAPDEILINVGREQAGR